METINGIIKGIKALGNRCCIECKSPDIDYFDRVYIEGELYSFPYCKNCGTVSWNVIPVFHLCLEKLYNFYLQLANEFHFSNEKILHDLEYIKGRKLFDKRRVTKYAC